MPSLADVMRNSNVQQEPLSPTLADAIKYANSLPPEEYQRAENDEKGNTKTDIGPRLPENTFYSPFSKLGQGVK